MPAYDTILQKHLEIERGASAHLRSTVGLSEERTPIAVVTGFLGAGKSTLLNKMIAQESHSRIAAIINEFGDVGLDHELVETSEENVTVLSSGCVCCTIREDLSKTISELHAKRQRGEVCFDRVVVETTGLADPAPIQRTLVSDPTLVHQVYLDGIVTLVDAVHGVGTLDRQFEAVSQAAMADLIVLTKTDLAGRLQVDTIRSRLEKLNGSAKIVDVSNVDTRMLWGCSAVRKGASVDDALQWIAQPTPDGAKDLLGNLSGLGSGRPSATSVVSAHGSKINTASIVLETPLERRKLAAWLQELTRLRGDCLLRTKGIVFLKDEDEPQVFHGVQHTFDRPVPLIGWAGKDRYSRIVIIARDISGSRLRRILNKLVAA